MPVQPTCSFSVGSPSPTPTGNPATRVDHRPRRPRTSDGRSLGREGQGWPWLYRNLLSVSETLAWVRTHGEIVVPDHSRVLVERATHADHLREVADQAGEKWQALWRRLFERDRIDAQLAEAGLVDWSRPYRNALIDDRCVTRLGEGIITIATPGRVSPFTTGDPIAASRSLPLGTGGGC